jgi:hypothetical protein
MTLHETLKAMRELIGDEKRWTQGEFARNDAGEVISINDPTATCFCLLGAFRRVGGWDQDARVLRVAMNVEHVGYFNDSHTHAEVIAKLDEAIEATQ